MQTEIEAKFLDVDINKIRRKLRSLGAKLVQPETPMVRKNFDFPNLSLQKISGWVRVRDESSKVTLAYKQLNNRTLTGTKEVGVTVSSFDDTCKFLESIGLEVKAVQETKRESWELNGTQVEIDTWPWVPTFVEIEGPTEKAVKDVAKLLDFNWDKALHGSVEIVYQTYFNVTEEEVDSWHITFSPTPKWLKRRSI